MAGVTHIVQIKFKDAIDTETIDEAINRLFSLKQQCLHPSSGKPYVISSRGGKECSVEGLQNGITHVFVTEFESVQDRDYYALEDPTHLAYGASLGGIVDKVQVVDFVESAF